MGHLLGGDDNVRRCLAAIAVQVYLRKKGGGRLGLQQVTHVLTGKPTRPLFRLILRGRWK